MQDNTKTGMFVFICGGVFGAVASSLISESGIISMSGGQALLVLVLVTILLCVNASLLMRETKTTIDRKLHAEWIQRTIKGENVGLMLSQATARQATEKIFAISHFVPRKFNRTQSESRTEYLSKGIIEAISRHLENFPSVPFRYERILQLERDDYEDAVNSRSGCTLKSKHLKNDLQTFEHCKKALLLKSRESRVEIDIYVSPPIPSFPSTLLVDGRHVHFALAASDVEGTPHELRSFGVFVTEDVEMAEAFETEYRRLRKTIAKRVLQIDDELVETH